MKVTNLRCEMVGKSVFPILAILLLSSFAVGDVFANNLASTNYMVSGTVGLLSLGVTTPVVDVNADSLTLGTLTTWTNKGTLGGSFGNDSTTPTVEKVAGRKAVVFDGSDRMLSTFNAPATITGNGDWTVCVWAYNPEISDEECMVQWANRGWASRTAQFNYGNDGTWGAATHWGSDDMPYGGGVPTAGQWHHLALKYTGGTNGTETVYVDGQYNYSETKTLNLFTNNPIRLANANGDKIFSGSLASVQIYPNALTQDEIKVVMNLKAWNPNPADESEDIIQPVTLQWSGRYQANWHDVYFGSDKTAVSNANNSGGSCDTCIYRARLSAGDTNYVIPEQLQASATYYWRIDELNSGGSVLSKGTVWSFTTRGLKASMPVPANVTTGIGLLPVLGWRSGVNAGRHNVFFSDDYNSVLNATVLYGDFNADGSVDAGDLNILATQWMGTCGEGPCADVDFNGKVDFKDYGYLANTWLSTGNGAYKGGLPVDTNTYSPPMLSPGVTYYWRIDEVNFTTGTAAVGNVWSFTASSTGVFDIGNNYFNLEFVKSLGSFTKMLRTGDSFGTQFILGPDDYSSYGISNPGWLLGDVSMKYRIGAGSWLNANTYTSSNNRQIAVDYISQRKTITITYSLPSGQSGGIKDFAVSQRWVLDGNSLALDVNIVNTTASNVELGDLAFPLPFNTYYDNSSTEEIQTKRLVRHGFFSGHGSHSYWTRGNGIAPFLVMTTPSPDTRFEYWDNIDVKDVYFKAYVYSQQVGNSTAGNWRQQHTSKVLTPGQGLHLKLNFSWADSLNEARDEIYENNDLDIQCVPGMTVPQDLYALIKIRTKDVINSIQAEYPADTTIQYVGDASPDTHIYKVQFNRIGENILRINHNGTEQTILEMFSCEPLETLIKKRATHMVNHEQVNDANKWYDGLFGEWDLRTSVLRTPDNTDGLTYEIASDDPGLGHAPYLASKNVYYPNQNEINACEYYIQHFVWGGLQYTDTEIYPWGIIGIPDWYSNRTYDPAHIWRVFDYPHIVTLYYHMYQIAKYYPDMVSYLDANGYLNRAYNTAMEYYNVASGWGYTVGTYNEVVFVDLIKSLREEGLTTEANNLEANWAQKVNYFIFEKEYPFGSEYAMDSTAFESTHALVKWAEDNTSLLNQDYLAANPTAVDKFMHGQMKANLAVRGCIEPAFYTYGSDYRYWGQTRYTLSYMSQMGGWAVIDYGLHWTTEQPLDYIRLGYGSYLSSWALMNTGPTGSGYWYPATANDGAIGWAFHPEKTGPIWLQDRQLDRGIWYYNGEIDLGLCGALRCSRSIVVNDPIFGLFGYGCDVALNGGVYNVVLKDGTREWLIMNNLGMELQLNRDSFAAGQNVSISEGKDSISFVLGNERPVAHTTRLTVKGLVAGTYSVKINSVLQYTVSVSGPDDEKQLDLAIGTASTYNISVSKI